MENVQNLEDVEYTQCTKGHSSCKSSYPQDKVPKILFRKDPQDANSKILKTCFHCREYERIHRKKSNISKSNVSPGTFDLETDPLTNTDLFLTCSKHPKNCGSPYPKHRVPMVEFYNEKGKLLKTCNWCRNRRKEIEKGHRTKKKEKIMENATEDGFSCCLSNIHNKCSTFQKEKVPISLFKKENGKLCKTCSHCREYGALQSKNYREKKMKRADENEENICRVCFVKIDESNVAFNLDGTISVVCKKCRGENAERYWKKREIYKDIVYSRIIEQKSSCLKCKKIYLYPENDTLISKSIDTYFKEGNIYVNWNGTEYSSSEFLEKNLALLETRVLHFDHLSEEEQRNRGILNPNETYIPKLQNVGEMASIDAMKTEAMKCQLICIYCHVEETERRAGIVKESERTYTYREKRKYVDSLKEKGCSSCGFIDKCLKKFDFDHIDETTKTDNIGTMVASGNYTLDDIKKEIEKCRILCKHCHSIKTLHNKRF